MEVTTFVPGKSAELPVTPMLQGTPHATGTLNGAEIADSLNLGALLQWPPLVSEVFSQRWVGLLSV